jgi:DNA-directed RNA polymerase specialized sigma24 family protein
VKRKNKFNSPINGGGISTSEIAEKIGVSPRRVIQIMQSAMNKIREELKRRGVVIGDYL